MYSNTVKRKSRDQKFFEFFKTIQLEYIVAELRYKIYPDDDSRRGKSLEIMKAKKIKIQDIALRNCFNTIFDDIIVGGKCYYDSCLKSELYAIVYTEPFPNFIYRDELHQRQLEGYDKKYYYRYGERFNTPEGIGILKKADMKADVYYLEVNGETFDFSSKNIVRIL